MMNQSEPNYVVRASYPTRDPYPVYKFHNDPQEWHCNGSVIVSCKDGKVDVKIMEQDSIQQESFSSERDPVSLEIFNNLFMGVAEQMGVSLQKTAHSVNIKERLDFRN